MKNLLILKPVCLFPRLLLATALFSQLFLAQAFGEAEFTKKVSAIKDGARIEMNFTHGHLPNGSVPVTVSLFTEVTDSKGNSYLIDLATLDDQHSHTASKVKRTYDINYDKINKELAKKAPHANLVVGPGTKMWVMARWMWDPKASKDPYNGSTLGTQHYFGGTAKANGDFTAPTPTNGWTGGSSNSGSGRSRNQKSFFEGGTSVDLDLANKAGADITGAFPKMTGTTLGSRYERELKLHVPLPDIKRLQTDLDALVNDPSEVERLFGQGATMVKDNRFVGKPMIDKYRDNKDMDAASAGAAVRFRTGGGVTNFNLKPDDGKYRGKGVFDRVEFEIQGATTANAIEDFADSNHPANFLQRLKDIASGKNSPSDFLAPSVKITDKRQKYKIKLASGEEVELSLDHVKARKMSGNRVVGDEVEYGQLEVEIDHMGAQGSNNFTNTSGNKKWNNQFSTLHGTKLDDFLKKLQPGSAIGGQAAAYNFHGEKDFPLTSPMHKVNKTTFANTNKVFETLRKKLFPKGAQASGQKYAVAAAALDLVDPKNYAPSVRQMLKEESGKAVSGAAARTCLLSMVKIHKK